MRNSSQYQPRKVTPETALKRAVKSYLLYKGWFCFPILQGLGAHRGISDYVAIKDGITYFLEIKTQHGRLSDYQVEFAYQVNKHGGRYLIVRSIEDLEREGI